MWGDLKKRSFIYTLLKKQMITLALSLLLFLIVINIIFDKGYRKYIFDPVFNTLVNSVISYQKNWSEMNAGFQDSYRSQIKKILLDTTLWYENNRDASTQQITQKLQTYSISPDQQTESLDWYLISKDGIIVQTNYPNDLGIELNQVVPKYWEFLKDLPIGDIHIDKMLYEVKTGIPRIYGYYRLSDGSFFEIGLRLQDNTLEKFIDQFIAFGNNTDYLENISVYTVSHEPFGNFPQLTNDDIRMFKKAENSTLYSYKEHSKETFLVYTSLYSDFFNPEEISPVVRTKFEIDFSQLIKIKNHFLVLFNLIIASILIIMLLINYQQVKRLIHNLNIIIKKVYDYEKNPASGLSDIDKHADFVETEKLGNAFKIMSHRITSLIKKQNKVNKNLQIAKDRLEVLASHDELTGVENRRTFFRKIIPLMNEDIYPWSLVFVDMDHLKKINDHYGHNLGDKALNLLGETLLMCTRSEDLISRIGGDEFVIALIKADEAKAEKILQRIQSILNEKGKIIHEDLTLSISYGITLINDNHNDDLEKMIQIADSKMYEQKKRKNPSQ